MVHMTIEPFVSIRAIRELLSRVMPEGMYIDKNLISNVKSRTRKKSLELDRS